MRLKNKVALITGAAGGIGAATARRFVDEGAQVALVDKDDTQVAELARTLGSRASAVYGDVGDRRSVDHAVQHVIERFGGLDIVFANAGVEGTVRQLVDYPVDEFDHLMQVNVRGAFLSIRYGAPALVKRGGGVIILTSSVAGLVGASGLGPYVASKHAVMGLMKTAAIELAPFGVRVVAINPGPVENRMMRSIETLASPGTPEKVKAGFEGMVPMHRYGKNEEIASLATFLASDEASYCTGSAYLADGGYVAQ